MWHLSIPFKGGSVEMVPRWGASLTAGGVIPWLLLGLVPLALIVWLYRYELKLVSRLVANFLLTLRMVVIVLLFFLVCFQPKLLPAFTQAAPERLLLMVDRTGSMDAADPQRPAADKLRLARALRLANDVASDLQLDEWIQQYQKNGLVRWVADDEYADDPDSKKRVGGQRKALHDRVCERADALTRTATVQRLLASDGGDLLAKLRKRYQVDVVGFARETWEPPADRLDQLFQWPADASAKQPQVDGELTTSPERALTDLNLPLSQALDQAVQGKGLLRGVVLLTDGRQNGGNVRETVAKELGDLKTRIFPVGLGTRQARATVAVTNIEAPSVVLKDPDDAPTVNAVVKANLRIRGLPAQALTVELKNGDRVLGRQRRAHNGEDRDYSVYFPISLDKEGAQKLTVEIQQPAGFADKTALRRPLEINVVKEQAEVLMIEGEARWEFHYVYVALGRDPLVKEVKSVVFEQPRLQKIPEADLKKQNWMSKTMPAEPEALADFDCIILGDARPEQLPMAERQRLARFVRETGGTLVIVAGKQAMPVLFPKTDPEHPENSDPLAELLPITEPRVVQSRAGFPMTLTTEGKDNPLLQMDDNKNEDGSPAPRDPAKKSLWQELPPHYWAVVGKKKPAATTLAFYPGEPEERDKEKTKAERETQSLIAWQNYGKGRVLFVGLDSTWRWRFKVGDKHHHRFWGQLIRWATADKLLAGRAGQVRYGVSKTTYEPGQEIDVRVRLAKELDLLPAKAPADKPYQARILRVAPDGKEERVAVVPLVVRPNQPRTLESRARDLPPGKYRVELDIPLLADKMREPDKPEDPRNSKPEFTVVAPPSEEMLDLSTDWALLQSLADQSKIDKTKAARVYTPEDAEQLLDELTRKNERVADEDIRQMWKWWPTLVLILLLLTIEWVARKWSGLP